MSDTKVRDLSTRTKVVEFLEEVLGDNLHGYASTYGEPGYSLPEGALVVLGDYWCRCGDFGTETLPNGKAVGKLHGVDKHHPEEWALLEERGYQFEWYDEWTIVYDEDAAYRTEPDSYHWKPTAVYNEEYGDYLTPRSGDDAWIESMKNDYNVCIPEGVLDETLAEHGWEQWGPRYENGWHPGQDAKPRDVFEEIRRYHRGADVVFQLDEASQFYLTFTAWWRVEVISS